MIDKGKTIKLKKEWREWSSYLEILNPHRQETEAVVQRCSVRKMFLEISKNVQENTCASVSFLIKFFNKVHAF